MKNNDLEPKYLSPLEPGKKWQIFLDEPADGPTNMRLDTELFENFEKGLIPPTLRIYSWSEPAVTYGYRQKEAVVGDTGVCHHSSARRPTGGGIVFHQPGELTLAAALPRKSKNYDDNLLEPFFFTSNLILKFLHSLGIKAEIKEKNFKRHRKLNHHFCFEEAAPFEITLNGQKILGLAQRRFRHSFGQQGTFQGLKISKEVPEKFRRFLKENLS